MKGQFVFLGALVGSVFWGFVALYSFPSSRSRYGSNPDFGPYIRGLRTPQVPLQYVYSNQLDESNPADKDGILLIHSYHEGQLVPGFDVLYDSFLVTQDLRKALFVQWMAEDWQNSTDHLKQDIVQRYSGYSYIQFRLLNHTELALGTCFADRPEFIEKSSIQKYGLRDWSNTIRLLLLAKYGGAWVDSDSILLLDLTHLEKHTEGGIIAGYAPDPKKDPKDKEGGNFNNNVLYLTNKKMREKIVEVSCEFRRKPLGTFDKKGNAQFENVIPLVGIDKHEMHVMFHWLFNDGVLRRCWMRNDCTVVQIGLGEFDPAWARTNDMYAMCEYYREALHGYTADFTDALRMRAWIDSTDYINTLDWKKHVWAIHTRAAHCRVPHTRPMSYLGWIQDALRSRIDNDLLRSPPVLPSDIITFDKYEIKRMDHDVEFASLIIAIESEASDFATRQRLRGMINTPAWFSQLNDAATFKFKLFFIVPYQKRNNAINSRLLLELHMYDDVIAVDPIQEGILQSYNVVLPPIGIISRRGVLKILNKWDAYSFLVLHNSYVFIDIPNLFSLINCASGKVLFQKEQSFESVLLTHPSDDQTVENGLREKYNATVYDHSRKQKFVIFTRNNLPALLGLGVESAEEGIAKVDYKSEHILTLPPSTIDEALGRIPVKVKASAQIAIAPVPGLVALTPADYHYQAGPFKALPQDVMNLGFSSGVCHSLPRSAVQKLDTIKNLTIVWDIPCHTASSDLFNLAFKSLRNPPLKFVS